MVKKLKTKVFNWPVALFLIEWCCFFSAFLINSSIYIKLVLLTIARVLP